MRRQVWTLWVVALIAGWAPGCKKQLRVPLDRVTVAAVDPEVLQGLGWTKEAIADRLQAALLQTQSFGPAAENGQRGWRVRFELDLLERPEPAQVHVRGMAAVIRPDEGQYDFDCYQEKGLPSVDRDNRRDVSRQALDEVIASCAEQAAQVVKAQGKDVRELLAQVDAGTLYAQDAALRVLVERRRPEALPGLLARLQLDDPMVVRRAIGALVELKDPRAASPLIDALKAKDAQFQREIVFALAAIGGDEAEAFLYTVAQGHEDPSLRAAAQAGLDEMGEPKRRRRDGGR